MACLRQSPVDLTDSASQRLAAGDTTEVEHIRLPGAGQARVYNVERFMCHLPRKPPKQSSTAPAPTTRRDARPSRGRGGTCNEAPAIVRSVGDGEDVHVVVAAAQVARELDQVARFSNTRSNDGMRIAIARMGWGNHLLRPREQGSSATSISRSWVPSGSSSGWRWPPPPNVELTETPASSEI
jgi:hypothetical protein